MRLTTPRRTPVALAVGLAALCFTVAACGGDDSSSSSSGGGGKNSKLTLLAGVKGDEFYITMNCGAQAEAKKEGVSLDFQGPDQFDPSLQTPIVNAVAAKKPDAVLSPRPTRRRWSRRSTSWPRTAPRSFSSTRPSAQPASPGPQIAPTNKAA